MSWCSRGVALVTVGFVLACGGGGDDAELEKALLESRLREAEMRAELAEAKAQGDKGSSEGSAPAKASTQRKAAGSSSAPAAGGSSVSEARQAREEDLLQQTGLSDASKKKAEPLGGEIEADDIDGLLGDFDDLDDEGSSGGLGAKLRDAVGSEVTVEGDARVVLVSSKGERVQLPAKVPPGKYDIEATFSGRAPVIVGNTAVKVGSNTVISCNPRMFICRAQ